MMAGWLVAALVLGAVGLALFGILWLPTRKSWNADGEADARRPSTAPAGTPDEPDADEARADNAAHAEGPQHGVANSESPR